MINLLILVTRSSSRSLVKKRLSVLINYNSTLFNIANICRLQYRKTPVLINETPIITYVPSIVKFSIVSQNHPKISIQLWLKIPLRLSLISVLSTPTNNLYLIFLEFAFITLKFIYIFQQYSISRGTNIVVLFYFSTLFSFYSQFHIFHSQQHTECIYLLSHSISIESVVMLFEQLATLYI